VIKKPVVRKPQKTLDTEKLLAEKNSQGLNTPSGGVAKEQKPVTKELKEEAAKKFLLTETQAQPMFMVIGLLTFAIALSAFAAGNSMRSRRRRH
jgi:hypothetical protein